ncbi:MAG: CpaF family protein [Candidatus Zixiibacteriota bacterium]
MFKFRQNSTVTRIPVSKHDEPAAPKTDVLPQRRDVFQELKVRLHRRLIDRLELTALASHDRGMLRQQIRDAAEVLIKEEGVFLNPEAKERLINEILNETLGLGPIEQHMSDPEVTDILVNGYDQVYIERFGKLELTETKFKDDNHVMLIIDRILSAVGRRVDESSPMVDARLSDGSRVNAIVPPVSLDGPMISIRRFRVDVLSMDDLLSNDSISMPMVQFLQGCVKARLNVLISGGTGAGKTTMLNIMSGYIPDGERIVTIEDSAELRLQQPHVVRLETRPPNVEGRGTVTQRDLVRNALRMRPNRIIIGEVRGPEIYDMLQAMNTGHDGSLTTIHANGPRDVLLRLETLMLLTGIEIPEKAIRELVSSAINIIVQISRYSDGSRRISSISEIVGMEQDTISMQEIFLFEKKGIDPEGRTMGIFRPTGIRPRYLQQMLASGVDLSPELFNP